MSLALGPLASRPFDRWPVNRGMNGAARWQGEAASATSAATTTRDATNRAYFDAQLAENAEWTKRMGVQLGAVFRPGAMVLDFGCGHGALAVQGAGHGAYVVGIDTNEQRIAFARRHVARAYPDLRHQIDFMCRAVEDLPGTELFDVIVSKDSFEHACGLDGILSAFRRLLKPGGRIYLGFSPLWYSPFGDHGFLTGRCMPWAHLLLGEARFLAAHNAHTGRPDGSIAEAGFNQLRPRDFRAAFQRHHLTVEAARINAASPAKRLAFAPLNAARRIPALEKFATVGMYLTLSVDRALPN